MTFTLCIAKISIVNMVAVFSLPSKSPGAVLDNFSVLVFFQPGGCSPASALIAAPTGFGGSKP
jgi:hypothetical protein